MKKKIGTYIVSLIIIVLTLGYDQWTKHIVEQSIQLNERIEVIKNFFYLTYVQNTGAGFSLFEGFGMTFFAIVTIVALILIGYIYFMVNDYRYQLALALVFSGAIGNFIDRLVLGYVRDFFSFYIFILACSLCTFLTIIIWHFLYLLAKHLIHLLYYTFYKNERLL